ncbi:MAG TPA: ShlB/FhaC/HecB family hemolysin secretion/activation protein [Burkholderiaceae bacterium]|nr:ShlB/FhaC/HecB family hemolysin secretion/activation protein [Burkholderiaceae bacterium]
MAWGAAYAQALTPEQQALQERQAQQELRLQQERARQLQRQQLRPDVRLEEAGSELGKGWLPAQEQPCFVIERIELMGRDVERFAWAAASANVTDEGEADAAEGRCLGSRGINLVMGRIQNAIVAKGFVTTRVLAGPQDLSSGVFQLTVVPGTIRHIAFSQDSSERARFGNALPARAGDVLNVRDIEQALENFKRLPTAEADIQILPAQGEGAAAGQSDVLIIWKQARFWRANASVDDAGSKVTGKRQGAVTLSLDHPFAINDLLFVNVNHDLGGGEDGRRGTRGHSVHYSVPYGYWLLSTTAGHNRYHQTVAGANALIEFSGQSDSVQLQVSRLVYRDQVRKSTVGMQLWSRSSKNFIDDTEVEVQRRQTAGWEFSLNHREFIGRAILDANLSYKRGTGALGAMAAPEEAFGEGTSRPKLLNADVQFSAPLAWGRQRFSYRGVWRAQWNRTPLVPQDRFSIGSRYTVRGFDGEAMLSADRGWLLRNDLDWIIGQSTQALYVGLDYGEVGGPSAANLAGRRLAGAVLGLRGQAFKGLAYDVFVSTPIKEPKRIVSAGHVSGFNLNWAY